VIDKMPLDNPFTQLLQQQATMQQAFEEEELRRKRKLMDPMTRAALEASGQITQKDVDKAGSFEDVIRRRKEDYLLEQNPTEVRKRMDEELSKKGFGGKFLEVLLAGLSGFGGQPTPREARYKRALEEYKTVAPIFQRDISAAERADVEREKLKISQDKNWQAFILGAERNGISRQTLELNRDKYEAMLPVWGAQAALAAAKTDQQKLETNILSETGAMPGRVGSEQIRQEALGGGDIRQGLLTQEAIKNLFRPERGTPQRPTLRSIPTVDAEGNPVTKMEWFYPPSGQTQQQPFNIHSQKLLRDLGVLPKEDQTPKPSPFVSPGQPAPTQRMPIRKTSAAPPALGGLKPTIPAPPTSTIGEAIKTVSIPHGTRTTQDKESGIYAKPNQKYQEAREARDSLHGRITTTTGSILSMPYTRLDKVLERFAYERWGVIGTPMAELALRSKDLTPEDITIRGDLADVKMEEILKFTGKQSNEREYKMMEQTAPTQGDSADTLLHKMFKRQLLINYWRWERDGEPGVSDGISKNYRGQLQEAFYGNLDAITKNLVADYKKGVPVTLERFHPQRHLYRTLEKIGKGGKK